MNDLNRNETPYSIFDRNNRYTRRALDLETSIAEAARDCFLRYHRMGYNARVSILRASRDVPANPHEDVLDDEFAYIWMNAVNDYAVGLLLGVEG